MDVRISIDSREVRGAIELLRREAPSAFADALNRTAFEILDAEAIEVKGSFPFMGQSAASFLSRSFVFDKATPDNLRVRIHPKPQAPAFLAEHAFGSEIEADRERLTFSGKLAVPIGVKRGARGRVSKAQLPGALLGAGQSFATQRAIFQRTGGRRVRGTQQSGRLRGTRLMYLLLERPVRLKKRFHFFEVAAKTALREFPKKAHRVLEKINLRRGR
jgi:hypothetical protein